MNEKRYCIELESVCKSNLDPAYEKRYLELRKRGKQLQTAQKALLIDVLKHNGGRITSHPVPVPDEDGETEYPITMTFYGKYDNPNISITDVYLNEREELFVDGIDDIGVVGRGFQVYPEQLPWVLDFIMIALGFKE